VAGLFDNVFSDYLWVRAVLLVGPTVASAGMAIQVPIAIFVEILIGHADWIHQYVSASLMIGGGITIVLGFLAVSTQPFVPEDKDG
jgi:solute carrier family 35 protein F5